MGQLASRSTPTTPEASTHSDVPALSPKRISAPVLWRAPNGGQPIPPEQIDKLFLPFKRGEARAGSRGLGLGLYIASQIAQAHDGRIDVRSDANDTCFRFKMPLKG
ncbi:sensor histidine kinase [Azospirillum thermophilum]|uniref:sensor histidine kinase n=1 Tax=Azospirillum thermophilum TaxID=2202148 RepID=UPI003CCB93D8